MIKNEAQQETIDRFDNKAPSREIIHLDMDAFYASVEVLDDPGLKGKPVIVGGLSGRGVVSTASYEARAFGVHSAMPIFTARKLCPNGVYLKPRMARYQTLSRQIMNIFQRYTPLVEPLSLDEAFLDVTGSVRLFGTAETIARRLKLEVFQETGLTVTAGVASQKHLAKIASGMNKPDSLTVVPRGQELEFLWPLPLKKLWGAGRVTLSKLAGLGLATIGDLAAMEQRVLIRLLGKSGAHLWELANGYDPREVTPDLPAKSIGSEETFSKNLTTEGEIKAALLAQTLEAVARLRQKSLWGRTITVKFRDDKFNTITRARTLPQPTDQRETVYQTSLELYAKEAHKLGPIRLLGVTISQLSLANEREDIPKQEQPSLFSDIAENKPPFANEKSKRLNQALDDIAARFGKDVIQPATLAKFPKKIP